MKKFVAFCLLVIMPATLAAQSEAGDLEPKIVKLERGQVLDLSLVTPFNSGQAHVGDEISFTLERDLNADQMTVLPKDRVIHGRITKVVRAGKNCKSGRVRWKLETVTTADGRKIKVQSIAWYLAQPRGVEVDRVSLDTTGEKIGKDTQYIAMVPFVVVFSPVLILMAIGLSAEGEKCHGTPGLEESVLPGTRFYFAVSKDVRLVQPSALPRGCDTPETVTDSPISSTHCD
jgi:hypothetical protein